MNATQPLIRKLMPGLLTKYSKQTWMSNRNFKDYLRYSKEVTNAIVAKKPVVALESTIITHGMPFPENFETAFQVEEVIREHGAVPATIAVMDGNIHIGLAEKEMITLSRSDSEVIKTSRRDLPYVLSQGLNGGTTVSGTVIAAHKAGIPVFVTGGVGGVHRGAETTMDVSTDLTELGRTPICVVSAGVKSILDIPRTLEYLETQGVCVVTYGPSREFPAFFTRDSGSQSPYNVNTPTEAAKLIDATLSIQLGSGMLIAVPIPESHAADGVVIEDAIERALAEVGGKDISGKDVTPYILQRVNELTQGMSLAANISLIKNNAKVGAQIACELNQLRSQSYVGKVGQTSTFHFHQPANEPYDTHHQQRMIVIGGTNVDFTCTFKVESVKLQQSETVQSGNLQLECYEETLENFIPQPNGATYPGTVQESFGGVGRNIADCLTRLGVNPLFISAVGSDTHAENFFYNCHHMDLTGVQRSSTHATACYNAILRWTGELIYGIGDFDIHSQITPDYVSTFEHHLSEAPIVCMDGNIPAETIAYVCDLCSHHKVPVWFEPTDLRLISKLFESNAWQQLTYISPNLNELRILNQKLAEMGQAGPSHSSPNTSSLPDYLAESVELVHPVLDHIPNVMVTLGKNGVLMCRNTAVDTMFPTKGIPQVADCMSMVHFPVRKAGQGLASIVSVSGAGDCLAGSMLRNILQQQKPVDCITAGLLAAQHSLKCHMAVPSTLYPETLDKTLVKKWVDMYCAPKQIL